MCSLRAQICPLEPKIWLLRPLTIRIMHSWSCPPVGHYIFVVNLANKNFHNHKLLSLPACSCRSLSCFWPVLNQFTYTWVSRRLDSTFSDITIWYPSVGLLVRSSRWPITLYLKRLKTDIAAVYPVFFSFLKGKKRGLTEVAWLLPMTFQIASLSVGWERWISDERS